MSPTPTLVALLINGVILAVPLLVIASLLSQFTRDVYRRYLLVAFLIIAALMYVAFAVREGASTAWVAAELLGIAVYGSLGLRGLHGSPGWLAAG